MTAELVEFLKAQLDEDELAARAASPSPWKDPYEDDSDSLWLTREDAYHIYRWEPARVLAEVEADRKLIAELERCGPSTQGHVGLLGAVKIRAERFADRPGYDERWRP